jgi:hypothetical protein
MEFYKVGDYYHYHSSIINEHLHPSRISVKEMEDGRIRFSLDIVGRSKNLDIQEHFTPNEITDRFGVPYGTNVYDILAKVNTGTDVNVSDQTTPAIIAPFNLIRTSTQLTNAVQVNDYQITVDNVGLADTLINNYLVFFHPASERFTQAFIKDVTGNVLTLDRLIDFAYPAGTFIDIGTINLANAGVGASLANPVTFGLRGTGAPPGVDITFDVTRLLLTARTDTAVDLAKFCDIPQLENGILFRRRDGETRNIFNIKSNGGIKAIAYDWEPYSAQNLNQGQHGMGSRLTFSGQNKIGVAIRLPIGDDLECIVVDPEIASISELSIIAEGHITNPY